MTAVTRALTWPLVMAAFVVDRLRRLPGSGRAARLVPWALGGMIVAAVLLVLAWGVEASPLRMSMSDLAAGRLPAMQSWIIVSGELAVDPSTSGGNRYVLTDPAVPLATLFVSSPKPLPLGPATVSGRIRGGREAVPAGYTWSADLTADAELANEIPPPPIAYALVIAAILIVAARRTAYPVFFGERPRDAPRTVGPIRVGVRRGTTGSNVDAEVSTPGTLTLDPGDRTPVTLRAGNGDPMTLRIHSALTGIDVGELRGVRWFAPALRLRLPLEDLTLTFTSRQSRDAAYAVLVDDAETASISR